jgi:hypothetical protein
MELVPVRTRQPCLSTISPYLLVSEQMTEGDHDLVCARDDGSAWPPDSFTSTFAALVRRAQLPKLRFHDLRHTHATQLLRQEKQPHVLPPRQETALSWSACGRSATSTSGSGSSSKARLTATPLAGYRWRARPEANGTNLDLWMPQLKLRRSGHDGRGVEARYARASASFASRTSVARLQS